MTRDRAVAVVSGAAGGLGRAMAAALAQAGWSVLGVEHPDRADAIPAACDGGLGIDLAEVGRDADAATAACDAIADALNGAPLGLLVNNAAVQHLAPTADLAWADWQASLAVNLSAPFVLVQGLLPFLRDAQGVVVNVGSVHATATKPGFAAYATSKAGLHGLTRALAVDLGGQVRVVGLAPAAVATPMLEAGFAGRAEARAALAAAHPVGRIATPDEVAAAVVFLASPAAGFMTGAVLSLDGGVLSRLNDPL